MSAYVILVGTEKYGTFSVIGPTIIGPFATHEEAAAFAESEAVESSRRSHLECYGGYADAVVISDAAVDSSPEDWLAIERDGEDEVIV